MTRCIARSHDEAHADMLAFFQRPRFDTATMSDDDLALWLNLVTWGDPDEVVASATTAGDPVRSDELQVLVQVFVTALRALQLATARLGQGAGLDQHHVTRRQAAHVERAFMNR